MRTCDPRTATELFGGECWYKATASSGNGTGCVEVNRTAPGLVGLRDSKHPHGPAFALTPTEWHALLTHIA